MNDLIKKIDDACANTNSVSNATYEVIKGLDIPTKKELAKHYGKVGHELYMSTIGQVPYTMPPYDFSNLFLSILAVDGQVTNHEFDVAKEVYAIAYDGAELDIPTLSDILQVAKYQFSAQCALSNVKEDQDGGKVVLLPLVQYATIILALTQDLNDNAIAYLRELEA